MRTTVRLPGELLTKAKEFAHERGTTLTALIEEGLIMVLERAPKAGKMKPVRVPVSKSTGGLQPGVDLSDSAALLDAMEQS